MQYNTTKLINKVTDFCEEHQFPFDIVYPMAYEQCDYLITLFEMSGLTDVLTEEDFEVIEDYLHGYMMYDSTLYEEGIRGEHLSQIYDQYRYIITSFVIQCIDKYQVYHTK